MNANLGFLTCCVDVFEATYEGVMGDSAMYGISLVHAILGYLVLNQGKYNHADTGHCTIIAEILNP